MLKTLLNVSFGSYVLAALISMAGFLMVKPWKYKAAFIPLVLGWLFHTGYIVWRWQMAGRAPLSNQFESLIFLVWATLGLFLVFALLSYSQVEWLIPWIALTAIVSLGVAALLNPSIEPLVPALQSNWLVIHVTTVLLGYASFMLAFVGGLVVLVKSRRAPEPSKLSTMDAFLYRSSALGFWLLTLGIITGAVWANSAWGTYWSWDPKETWSLVTWLFYAIAIHLRRTRGWRQQRFAWLTVTGFAFVIFTYFGVNYLLSGLHSYA